MLGPALPSSTLRAELDRIERAVVARDPALAEHLPKERAPSPRLEDPVKPADRWWPSGDLQPNGASPTPAGTGG
jgi:hypothetical protein